MLLEAVFPRDDPAPEDPACRDYEEFFRRTRYVMPAEPDEAVVQRFVKEIAATEEGIEVRFKAGIVIATV